MIKQIVTITLASLLLGGCTLTDAFKTGDAAKDTKPMVAASAAPDPTMSPDPKLEVMPSTTGSSDAQSLETDINNTMILEEDFSDLK